MKKILYLFILLVISCLVSACQASFALSPSSLPVDTATTEIVSTPVPSTVQPEIVSTPIPSTLQSASPEPSPEHTPVPFSIYAPTVNMSFEELVGDDGYYKDPIGFPRNDTYEVIVDIYHQVVMVYSKDSSGGYKVPVRYMLCSTGLHGSTPTGTFKMQKYHVRFGLFHVERLYGQYWSEIRGRIYFHTMLYTERDATTYIKETYDKLGSPDSHGCIRLTAPDARWIYYNIAPGTKIVIRKGSKDDSATAQIRSQLILAPSPEENIQLVKGDIPDTDNWTIAQVPDEVPFKQGRQN